ncbi:MAG TPA: hypothetical protein VNV44_00485 [Solirubrobacteraceae bacterium]|nr:hypothetical protein [Solirubrobacteraceae bacterium]
MDREQADRAAENALVHRRPGTWRGVLLCLLLALVGAVLALASASTRGIGLGIAVLGVLCALAGGVHLMRPSRGDAPPGGR